ncbi:MAG: glycosyltransferase family 2 protein [Cyanobacteria bacterium CRU_2_1]|nr:glycosyltransferase family 2 protein [Hydrococcus sp. RU_2_2]NJR60336.1 glycosyltransferase family 2 protein [Cyanobacteria bacterium CRU_2_1]
MPKISVCIPTYNRKKLLPIAISSVLQQTYSDFEVIVCDDGSIDGTPEMMAQFIDPRIRYVRHSQNIGKSNNMRSGFAAATGEYFIKFDDDDRLTPEFLAKTSAVLDAHPEIDCVGTDHWVIDIDNTRDPAMSDRNSQHWGRSTLQTGEIQNLLDVVFVHQSLQVGATLFRRQALLNMGYMRPNIQNCEDNDLFVRLALAGRKAYYLPERLMEYRYHAEQQGIDRAISYLKDKITYLENFQFESEKLERIRQFRLAETKLLLGLRMINTGDLQTGRTLVWAGKTASPLRAITGLGLSSFPPGLRNQAFQFVRQITR